MLKICGSSIYGSLELILKEALSTGLFPSNWKKGNIVPIHKKGDKQILKNYRPVSLLPICGKIFERLIFNEQFNFLLENNLISPNQSWFKPGDFALIKEFFLMVKHLSGEMSPQVFLKVPF